MNFDIDTSTKKIKKTKKSKQKKEIIIAIFFLLLSIILMIVHFMLNNKMEAPTVPEKKENVEKAKERFKKYIK